MADIAAGTYAYSGILSALLRRERTGEGATLVVSMLEALGEWMGFPLYTLYGGAEEERGTPRSRRGPVRLSEARWERRLRRLLDTNVCTHIIRRRPQAVLRRFEDYGIGEVGGSSPLVGSLYSSWIRVVSRAPGRHGDENHLA